MPEEKSPYDFTPPPFLEDQGWEQMRRLLDEHLPQQPKGGVFRLFPWQAVAACAAGLLCLVTPSLLKDSRQPAAGNGHTIAVTAGDSSRQHDAYTAGIQPVQPAVAAPEKTPVDVDTGPATASAAAKAPSTLSAAFTNKIHSANHTQPIDTTVHNTPLPVTAFNGTSSFPNTTGNLNNTGNTSNTGHQPAAVAGTGTTAPPGTGTLSSGTTASSVPPAQKQKPMVWPSFDVPSARKNATEHPHGVNVAVQLNRNMAGHVSQSEQQLYDLPVYPSLLASVNISQKFSLSTGISAFTPGNFGSTATPPQSLVMSGSTEPTNFSVVNGKETIRQAYYWQVPVTLNFSLRKNLTLSAGTSLAFLQKVLIQRDETAYSYSPSVNTSTNTSRSLLSADALSNTSAGATYSVRRFDPRMVLGAQYQLNRFQIGVQYGRSISNSVVFKNAPDGKGNKNEILNFSVGYNLFQQKKK
jgi:hypothetical protein